MVMMKIGPAARVAIAACGFGLILQRHPSAPGTPTPAPTLPQLNGPSGIERAGEFAFLASELD